ncbi:MAG: 3'-5' exonuclease [Cyclobacteriaceae bacterium]
MELSITKEVLQQLPLLQFEGRIVVINTSHALDSVVDELRKHRVVGIDTEARPSFRKGEYHPTSLVQISIDSKCFLIRLQSTGFTDKLIEYFEDDSFKKIGIALHDDLIDLKRIKKFKPAGFIDLNKRATAMGMDDIGAKKLSGIFLNGRISKTQQTSNWENKILTPAQKTYAATDAWICLKIYEVMQEEGMV